MRYLQLIVLLTALACQSASARPRRVARPNPSMTAFQNFLTSGHNPMPIRNRRLSAETAMPVNGINVPLPYIRSVQQKCPCQCEKPTPRLLPEMRVPEILQVQEIRRPSSIITDMSNQYIPELRMPASIVSNMPVSAVSTPARLVPDVIDMPLAIRSIPEINMQRIQERFECPCAGPKALVNPFLPAASPVSAFAPPTSNLLPSVNPNIARTNYLRKIPFPPPTL